MTKVLDKAIAAFVTDVKAALGGQDPNVIADLTDNLEADLLDRQAAEGAEFKLGNPKAYANELLASAGLLTVAGADSRGRRFWRAVGGAVWRFLKTVRPTWWVLRGLMAYTLIWFVLLKQNKYFPDNFGAWLALAVMVVISVQIGRANLRHWAVRVPLAVLNLVAVVTAGFWLISFNNLRDDYQRLEAEYHSDLLLSHGHIVGFVNAFDKNGKKLPMATLKEPDGTQLYEAPANLILPEGIAKLVGMSLKNAVAQLTALGYFNVSIDYEHVAETQAGNIASVQLVNDTFGNEYVQLVVSK
jgi:hypothetical protein